MIGPLRYRRGGNRPQPPPRCDGKGITAHDHRRGTVEESETPHDLHDQEEWSGLKETVLIIYSINRDSKIM
jgi:hypothetical protein